MMVSQTAPQENPKEDPVLKKLDLTQGNLRQRKAQNAKQENQTPKQTKTLGINCRFGMTLGIGRLHNLLQII